MSYEPPTYPDFLPGVLSPQPDGEPSWWFCFQDDRLLLRDEGEGLAVPLAVEPAALGLVPLRVQYLGTLRGRGCFSADLPEESLTSPDLSPHRLRAVFGRLPDDLFWLAGRAFQVIDWDRTHLYCGRCGAGVEQSDGERAKKCPACGLVSYPRVAPAVIVLISRGNEVLLARARNFPGDFYSILAGFVEPGESLEEAIAREVREEVGIEITGLRYFGSQPWPFPHSLMVGFFALYAAGEIVIEESEMAEARWFTGDSLPEIPPPLSIARRMIDAFVAGER